MSARRSPLLVAVATLLALGVTACAPGDGPGPTFTPLDVGPPSLPSADVALPDGVAGQHASWVLAQLEPGAEADAGEVADRFAAPFLAEVSAEDLVTVLAQLRDLGPWTLASVENGPGWLVARITGDASELDMQLAHDDDDLITTLLFTPAPPPREPAQSMPGLAEEVEALAGSTSLYVARVVDGRCEPFDGMPGGTTPGESLPMGSMVKLYVLGAVVDAVESGDLEWDDEVTVTDELRSLPSGQLQDEPTGTSVSVRAAAEAMIAISDNTATDLLIDAVGRERVEEAFSRLGHAEPGRNVPLATTRDLFLLGWGEAEDLREQWRDADEAGRRAILDSLAGAELDVDLAQVVQVPVWPYDVDWFATGADLCAAHVALAELAATPAGEPVRDILSANPGIEVPAGYEYVAFKGGSSTGTMGGSWYAETTDGAVVVVLQTAAQAQPTQAATMVGIAEDALRLAAAAL